MKKFILILMMFVTSSMFGYYTTDGFIDFLVDTNQFRARLDRVGFKLAVNNFHIAAGLTGANGGLLLQSSKENPFLEEGTNTIVFQPNAIVGFGYKTPNYNLVLQILMINIIHIHIIHKLITS